MSRRRKYGNRPTTWRESRLDAVAQRRMDGLHREEALDGEELRR